MKTTMFLIAMFLTSLLTCAEELAGSPHFPWVTSNKDGQIVYSIDYSGKGCPGIEFSAKVEPESYYVVTWQLKASSASPEDRIFLGVRVGEDKYQAGTNQFVVNENWGRYTAYFYSGKECSAKMYLYCKENIGKCEFQAKEFSLNKLNLNNFKENLLPDGAFESSTVLPVFWRKTWSTRKMPASIKAVPDFMDGERSLAIEFPANPEAIIACESNWMPIIPGKEFELEFWAKADKPFKVNISLDCQYQPHRPSHLYKCFSESIGTQWKQYSIRMFVPSDMKTFPDLQARVLFIRIFAKDYPEAAQVYFDNMRFRLVDDAETSKESARP